MARRSATARIAPERVPPDRLRDVNLAIESQKHPVFSLSRKRQTLVRSPQIVTNLSHASLGATAQFQSLD
jgi:hypothetical protein